MAPSASYWSSGRRRWRVLVKSWCSAYLGLCPGARSKVSGPRGEHDCGSDVPVSSASVVWRGDRSLYLSKSRPGRPPCRCGPACLSSKSFNFFLMTIGVKTSLPVFSCITMFRLLSGEGEAPEEIPLGALYLRSWRPALWISIVFLPPPKNLSSSVRYNMALKLGTSPPGDAAPWPESPARRHPSTLPFSVLSVPSLVSCLLPESSMNIGGIAYISSRSFSTLETSLGVVPTLELFYFLTCWPLLLRENACFLMLRFTLFLKTPLF